MFIYNSPSTGKMSVSFELLDFYGDTYMKMCKSLSAGS